MFRIPSKSRYTAIILGIRIDPVIDTYDEYLCIFQNQIEISHIHLYILMNINRFQILFRNIFK